VKKVVFENSNLGDSLLNNQKKMKQMQMEQTMAKISTQVQMMKEMETKQ
jgi:hypothetical protein